LKALLPNGLSTWNPSKGHNPPQLTLKTQKVNPFLGASLQNGREGSVAFNHHGARVKRAKSQ